MTLIRSTSISIRSSNDSAAAKLGKMFREETNVLGGRRRRPRLIGGMAHNRHRF